MIGGKAVLARRSDLSGGAPDPGAVCGDPPQTRDAGVFLNGIQIWKACVQPRAARCFRRVAGNSTRVACSTRELPSDPVPQPHEFAECISKHTPHCPKNEGQRPGTISAWGNAPGCRHETDKGLKARPIARTVRNGSGFQPSVFSRHESWGVAPGWDGLRRWRTKNAGTILPFNFLRSCLALLLFVLAFVAPARAHNVDTSYARVRIFADHLEVRLTLDIFTLQRIVPDLDANRDAALSRDELLRATPAIQKFLRANVGIEINEAASDLGEAKDPFWPLDAPDPIPAAAWHTNEALVSFGFDKPLASPPKAVALLFGVFRTLGERHSVLGVFEYRGKSTEVVFTLAEPDYLFDVAFAESPVVTAPGNNADAAPAPKTEKSNEPDARGKATTHRSNADDSPVWRYFKMGIGHILTGYDHLCFLLALIVVSCLRPLIAIVTSFTIAHSITLLLAAFEIVRLPSRFIECSIAITIVYVGVENLCRTKFAHRWMLTFFFGLIHGFGFANTLSPQELPAQAKAKCLVVFNLGVEAGQLAVVLALLPLALALAKWKHGPRAKIAISITVALLGLAWFLDRVFALGWMPF